MTNTKSDTPTQADAYSFIVDYKDNLSGVNTKYQLVYYPNDNSVEMFDFKSDGDTTKRRCFLKRVVVPNLSLDDLYIGGKVSVCSRLLTIADYFDVATRNLLLPKQEKTLALIAVTEEMGKIINMIQGPKNARVSVATGGRDNSRAGSRDGIRDGRNGNSKDNGKPINKEGSGLIVSEMKIVNLSRSDVVNLQRTGGGHRGLMEGAWLAVELQGENCTAKWAALSDSINAQSDYPIATGSASAEKAKNEIPLLFVKRPSTATYTNSSLCIIKPHAVAAGNTGDIIDMITDDGYQITALETMTIPLATAKQLLEPYNGVLNDVKLLEHELSNGPSVVMEVTSSSPKGDNSVKAFRELCGPFDPEIAKPLRPDSIRARFGLSRVQNAVHCTDLPEDGQGEVWMFLK